MEKSFIDAVEKAYANGENSNPQFREAIDYVKNIAEKATMKTREIKINKNKDKENTR